MRRLAKLFPPPPSHPAYNALSALARRTAERDLSVRQWLQELSKKGPSFMLSRLEGGSGFPVANVLREYFRDYGKRMIEVGPRSLPSSFNVIESFLRFSHDYFVFDLREEREHLLRLRDYLDWYTATNIPEDPGVLTEVIQEGIVYSYNMVDPAGDFRVEIPGSELVISGVAMVRHMTELSMVILCGEASPPTSDEEAGQLYETMVPISEKEGLGPGPEYSVEDRYLAEIPGYVRVIGLVRVDLVSRQSSVRYVNQDLGSGYLIASDDPTLFLTVTQAERADYVMTMAKDLTRYEPLFASLWSLMYLPVLFIDEQERVARTTFSTELGTRRQSTEVRRAVRHLGRHSITFLRTVRCLQVDGTNSIEDGMTVSPPKMEQSASGFWKPLPPGQVGEDEHGNPVMGKNWVERTDMWPASRCAVDFVVRKRRRPVQGAKPGRVYVLRSSGHGLDIYKIGKTQRTPGVRARELSSATGVPTPFEELGSWEVGDIDFVEKEAHRRLEAYRVSRKREFFRAPLSTIGSVIDSIVREQSEAAAFDK